MSEEFLDVNEDLNGLFLSKTFFPEEIIENILILVSWKDLLSCRLVCLSWKNFIDSFVAFEKLKQFHKKSVQSSFTNPITKSIAIPFNLYYAIAQKSFGNNLLKNAFGSGDDPHVCSRSRSRWQQRSRYIKVCDSENCPKFRHWSITQSQGDGWAVEAEPVGSEPLPTHLEGRSCFVTSFSACHKEQCINLKECGLNAKIMDEIQPHIDVSEWYAKRFDCGIIYTLRVSLLNAERGVVDVFEEVKEDRTGPNEWHQVSYTFKDYGPGIRYVLFEHEGKDTQFWAGHYGPKMAGGSVIARIPSSLFQSARDLG